MFLGRAGAFAALVALLGSLALAAPAGADTTSKPYSLTISPDTTVSPYTTYETPGNGEVASGEAVQISATFTNETGTQQMGSANLFPPSGGFVLLGPPNFAAPTSTAGTPTVMSSCTNHGVAAGPCVQVLNMAAAPGASVTVTMWVQTPRCQSGNSAPWTAEVKQANNFSGSPGNDFSFDSLNSLPDTTLDGACSLKFVNQPAEAVTGQAIGNQIFTPPPPPVTVEVRNSSNAIVGTSSVPVTMGLQSNPGNAKLGGSTTKAAVGGTASFSDLTLDKAGYPYQLLASSGILNRDTSSPFAIQDTEAPCTAGSLNCGQSDGTSNGNQASVQATPTSSGFLTLSVAFNANAGLVCTGYKSIDPNTYTAVTLDSTGNPVGWAKSGTITIVPTTNLGNAKQALKAQQICFGAPYQFATVPGTPLTPGTLPDGSQGNIGLLPDCPGNLNNATGPCHNRAADTTSPDHRTKSGYDIILALFIPAGLSADPHFG